MAKCTQIKKFLESETKKSKSTRKSRLKIELNKKNKYLRHTIHSDLLLSIN
jgi:hypothetical protein